MRTQDGIGYLEGPITLKEALSVRQEGETMIANGCAIVDLSGISRVDSSALSVLLAWRRFASNSGTTVDFRNIPDSLQSLIELYGVNALVGS